MRVYTQAVGVSAMTGDGMREFFDAVEEAKQEYLNEYKPELDKVIADRERKKTQSRQESMSKLMRDLSVSKKEGGDTDLDKYLDPKQDVEQKEQESSDDGEVIDKNARTAYWKLSDDEEDGEDEGQPRRGPRTVQPFTSKGRGGQVEGDDGTVWPAP